MYKDMLKEVFKEYENKRDIQKRLQESRIQEVYRKVPDIKKVDEEIFQMGLKMSKHIIGNPKGYEKSVKEARKSIEKLKMKKAFMLTESNINLDYMDLKYECHECQDTGFLENGKKCICLEQRLVSRAYSMSNLDHMLEKENFRTFDIDVFRDEKFENEKMTPRENMTDIVGIAEGFIANFEEKNGDNLLFYGSTGLGKTFLSNCIAKALLDKNKIVIYQTAFTILEILENRRFSKTDKAMSDYQYNLLLDSDLLIIDDLGTEMANAFTNSEIFNIVNTRILRGKKTIISTNLTPKEISATYTDRIFSRILDKFLPLKFFGKDLRWE